MAGTRREPRYDITNAIPGREAFRRGELLHYRRGTFTVTNLPSADRADRRDRPPHGPSRGGPGSGGAPLPPNAPPRRDDDR